MTLDPNAHSDDQPRQEEIDRLADMHQGLFDELSSIGDVAAQRDTPGSAQVADMATALVEAFSAVAQ